jgi:hypothetical protein
MAFRRKRVELIALITTLFSQGAACASAASGRSLRWRRRSEKALDNLALKAHPKRKWDQAAQLIIDL